MGLWGGHGAGGWSSAGHPGMQRPGLRRTTDGWDDEELGRVYDHAVVRRLFPYLKPYKRQVIYSMAAMIIVAAVPNLQALLIGIAIDDYVPSGDLQAISAIGVFMI